MVRANGKQRIGCNIEHSYNDHIANETTPHLTAAAVYCEWGGYFKGASRAKT